MEIMTSAGPAHVALGQPERGAGARGAGAAGREPRLLVALTHGAGGTPDTPDLLAVSAAARASGAVTALVTQPYRVRGGRAPGPAARQDAAWLEIIAALRRAVPGPPLIQGGRSNGARLACRTARAAGASGVIALAFPLRPPGSPGRSREAELRGAGTSVLVISGDRDPFGVPEPDPVTRVVVLAGRAHALSGGAAAISAAVSGWLDELHDLSSRD